MNCDRCDKPATVHLIEIKNGKKIEKHLCEQHAVEEGVAVKVNHPPINELLEKFVLKHSGAAGESKPRERACPECGLTYGEFRKSGLLGCPNCYEAFAEPLAPLLERAQGGAKEHIGKFPHHMDHLYQRQQQLLRLRQELGEAVAQEQYERAAKLRDMVQQIESRDS